MCDGSLLFSWFSDKGLVPTHLCHLAVFAFRHPGMPQGEPGFAICGFFKRHRHQQFKREVLSHAVVRARVDRADCADLRHRQAFEVVKYGCTNGFVVPRSPRH